MKGREMKLLSLGSSVISNGIISNGT